MLFWLLLAELKIWADICDVRAISKKSKINLAILTHINLYL